MALRSYVRPMTEQRTTHHLEELAHAVVSEGFDPHRDALADLVRTARRLGVRPVLADVLADTSAPRPVRERALGLLLVALDAHRSSSLVTTGAAPAA